MARPTLADGRVPASSHRTQAPVPPLLTHRDRKSTRLNSSHLVISYAVFCLKKKKKTSSLLLSCSELHHPTSLLCTPRRLLRRPSGRSGAVPPSRRSFYARISCCRHRANTSH